MASHGLAWTFLGLAQASGGVDGWADEQNFSPFYRTLSPNDFFFLEAEDGGTLP